MCIGTNGALDPRPAGVVTLQGVGGAASSSRVPQLAAGLALDVPVLTERLYQLILASQDAYRRLDPELLADVRRSCQDNICEILGSLAQQRPPSTDAPFETARRRADMGVPLGAVLHAYRLGYRVIWEALLAHARLQGDISTDELAEMGGALWDSIDAFSEVVHAAYRDALVDRARQSEQQRVSLFDALLEGRVEEWAVVGDGARVLDLPAAGLFVAVSGDGNGLARAEQALRRDGLRSVWRARADEYVGVVALDREHPLPAVRRLLCSVATARVGISPPYARLADTGWAVGLAAVARACSPPGTVAVNTLEDRPIATLVSAGRAVAEQVARSVIGPVLALDPADRALLLETLEVWFDAGGSAAEAGQRMFCHRNTVRNRLQRMEELTGRSLSDPTATSELRVALEVVRLLDLG